MHRNLSLITKTTVTKTVTSLAIYEEQSVR